MRRVLCGLVLLSLVGCASQRSRFQAAPKVIALQPGAEMVELLDFVSEDRLADYEESIATECRLGMNYSDLRANLEACENAIRNDALANGAAIAWVKPEWRQLGGDENCANCVELRAVLLVRKSVKTRSAKRY